MFTCTKSPKKIGVRRYITTYRELYQQKNLDTKRDLLHTLKLKLVTNTVPACLLYNLLTFSGKGVQQIWTRGGFSRHSPFSS